ncbi:MAG TPA: PAS domain-containing sensor histidine kinase, partial [Candidatus Obscuribacterales bacterium]
SPPLEGEDEIARLDRVIHEAAVAIAEAQRKERAAIENAADVICSIDAEGKFTAVSPACVQLWGYKPEELVGRNWVEVVETAEVEPCRRWAEKVREKAQTSPLENKVLRKDGSSIDMRWSGHWSESEQSMFCVAHDITERKELERFKQQFVAMVSHDLRTPLSAVQSTLSLLATGAWGGLSDKGQHKVASAKRNIHESINLINDLLDLEKMEAGKLELEIAETALLPILQRSADAVAALAEARGIKIELPAADAVVLADSGRLSQVMVNLLGNAVKFSPDGATVTVGLVESADWAEIRVTDQGPGIPEAYRQAVFERFQQVPGSSSKRGGTGLGLPICKAIIEAHGGSIGVESEEGKGSTFWLRVPT